MNRKNFLSSIVVTTTAVPFIGTGKQHLFKDNPIIPSYLKPGDIIGITCPAGYTTKEEILPSILQMESWGFNIRIGNTIGKRVFTFGGTDAERTNDLQQMLDDQSIKAIMCARGGYPVGHQRNNYAFKCGVRHRLEMNDTSATLKEI